MIPRDIVSTIRATAAIRPALLLSGARQTGKSTVLKEAIGGFRYVTLDLPQHSEEAEDAGREFLRRYPAPLIIDEVQYAPKLFRYLKEAIDRNRDRNGQYILTGSQLFPLFEGASDSLAGRIAILNLHTLSLHELERGFGKRAEGWQLLDWILSGGYPEIHAKGIPFERFYADYVATYLERDVRQAIQVRNLRDFNRFLRLAASRTGQMLGLTSLASDLGISANTVKAWLSVLEASGIVRLLEPYYQNLGKRTVKTPKLYFMDTGLVCFLTGIRTTTALQESTMLGPIFETLALGQLVRSFHHRGLAADIYYYRDHHGHEVDFLIPHGEKLELYECKWAEQAPSELPGFAHIEKLIGAGNIVDRVLLTPVRGSRRLESRGLTIRDCVDPRGDYAAGEDGAVTAGSSTDT